MSIDAIALPAVAVGRRARIAWAAGLLLSVAAALWLWLALGARSGDGVVRDLGRGEVTLNVAPRLTAGRWAKTTSPTLVSISTVPPGRILQTKWARFHFNGGALPHAPLALLSLRQSQAFAVFLNGHALYSTDAAAYDRDFEWNRPHLLPISPELLNVGTNELIVRVRSKPPQPLSIGTLQIGPEVAVRRAYQRLFYFDVVGPEIINGVLAILIVGALLAWCARPREQIFGWLALVGGLWWFRNLSSYVSAVPIDVDLFWSLTTDTVFALMAATYGFAATFLKLSNRRALIGTVTTGLAATTLGRHLLDALHLNDLPSFLLTLPVAGMTLYLLAQACRHDPKIENMLMLLAVVAATAFGFHDLGLVKTLWHGASIHLLPYGSLLVFSAFGLALGRRVLDALAAVETVNATLEARVAAATAGLALSEQARRQLEVAGAVKVERERLMREIHDGIGSSLITALAVAERQQQSPNSIATLKRSIADLRIAVDSLEPIDGDVGMLLASLRYRMERELRAAGLTFVWSVQPTPPLEWLDSVGALHLLRIMQEAIGNILIHARAEHVYVSCTASFDGRAGVSIGICDDGCGFDTAVQVNGRGLANMTARALTLSSRISVSSTAGEGTSIALWLPCVRITR